VGSLDPRQKVAEAVAEPLKTHRQITAAARRGRVLELLEQVGLGRQHLDRFPHEISGGQCQRVAIARALALEPKLLVLDEPTSALDVSVQAQILNLLEDLRERLNLTYIFISHDLSVVQHISDRIGVMYLGKLVELGHSEQIFESAAHPYTQALLGAIPVPEAARQEELVVLEGSVPSPSNPPPGCRFHTRCPLSEAICRTEEPQMREIRPGHYAACHLIEVSSPQD
jgi:oligopeptide/dipeptide ABC transporter ATP-binding protein